MDSTPYYNTNASKFIDDTVNADMSAIRDRFLVYIPSCGTILDAGCGPGRDVYKVLVWLVFLENKTAVR